ncbi:MAG: SpoIIE family protein phosphatase [Betaproteobacteria bacterium]|nr:SpoIIE family protein phosphatase [Betaproteobacteria bacterium]
MIEGQPPASEAARHALPSGLIHDLRTPLNHIIGYTEMLIEQAQEKAQDNFVPDLQKTHAAGKQLLSLINDSFHPIRSADTRAASAAPSEEGPTTTKQKSAAEASTENPVARTDQGLVLVVDDVENNRDVLSRRLEHQGYAVATAENGRQALERLRADTFDLVLLDIMMPEMDGYEVLQRLKADEALRPIPVIMISALSELDSVVRCIGMGAEDYLPKPFNPTLLKARIGACLEKKRARDRETGLFEQLQDRNREMARWREAHEADLAVARTTQQAIVTSALPRLDGWQVETVYRPLIEVGGDVYGWRRLDDGSWLFWLADATGHGVAAALFTTLVALLFNHASTESGTAHEILARVNAEFYSVLRGRSFMTACCAVIGADGQLSFAGAGHPPLLLRRRDGTVEALPSRSTMIGIYAAVEIGETLATLASGDVALLYTDGLYSSKSNGGERLTGNTLMAAFAGVGGSADFLPRLITQLGPPSGAQGFDDDVAAIALRRG